MVFLVFIIIMWVLLGGVLGLHVWCEYAWPSRSLIKSAVAFILFGPVFWSFCAVTAGVALFQEWLEGNK